MKFLSAIIATIGTLFLTACSSTMHIPWIQKDLPEGTLQLSHDEPWVYAPHHVHIAFKPVGSTESWDLGSTELHNDGANLGEHNFSLLPAVDGELGFVLTGQEQEPETLRIVFVEGAAPGLLRGAK